MPKVVKTVVINAPLKKIFDVITDFEKYPEFIPEMREVHVLKRKYTTLEVKFMAELIRIIEYVLRIKIAHPKSISWELVSGSMLSHNHGSWEFKELKHNSIEATYTIDVEPTLLVPRSMMQVLMESNLPRMLDNFKNRIESLVKGEAKRAKKIGVAKVKKMGKLAKAKR